MVRSILTAVALAGVLAAAQPAFADPVAGTASDHVQAVAAAAEQSAPRAATENSQRDVNFAAVGFGWG